MDRDNNVEKTKDKINVKNSLKIKASLLKYSSDPIAIDDILEKPLRLLKSIRDIITNVEIRMKISLIFKKFFLLKNQRSINNIDKKKVRKYLKLNKFSSK
tara:strand:- start:224 stop:523 length:300 start_codon:yes stop_codon:yes gene_type:complete